VEESNPMACRNAWNGYSDQWPENNVGHKGWKPNTLLPAPKALIKRGAKLCFAQWPRPIIRSDWSSFYMMFVDLAHHIPAEQCEIVNRFSRSDLTCFRQMPLLILSQP